MVQKQKWDQTQCSYCGEKGRQFVCSECLESTEEQVNSRIETMQKQIDVLQKEIAFLVKHGAWTRRAMKDVKQ